LLYSVYTLTILCLYTVYTLSILCLYTCYTLSIHLLYSVYTLSIHLLYSVYTLSILLYTCYTLSIHLLYSIHTMLYILLYTYSIHTLHILYTYSTHTLYILYTYYTLLLYSPLYTAAPSSCGTTVKENVSRPTRAIRTRSTASSPTFLLPEGSGSSLVQRIRWFTCGTCRLRRSYRLYLDTQVCILYLNRLYLHTQVCNLYLVIQVCNLYLVIQVCNLYLVIQVCINGDNVCCRRSPVLCLSPHREYHSLCRSRERQDYQTLEER